MKKIIYLVAIQIGLAGAINAQPYKSIFSADTVEWNVFESAPDAGGTIQYFSISDFNIDTVTYHLIYRDFFRDYPTDNILDLGFFYGLIREDTLEGKYYFVMGDDPVSSEKLIMDLNLEPGDTFHYVDWNNYTNLFIVDSVSFENDRKSIVFKQTHMVGSEESPITFNEGIGPSYGFCMGETENYGSYSLMCKKENLAVVYQSLADINGTCFREGYAGINDVSQLLPLIISPNPSQGDIQITLADPGLSYNFLLYNMNGEVVNSGVINTGQLDLNIEIPGLYYLYLTDGYNYATKLVIIR